MIRRWSQVCLFLSGVAVAALAVSPAVASGQTRGASTLADSARSDLADRPLVTRSALQSRLQELRKQVEDPVYTENRRAELRQRIEEIRRRLEHGDFRQGDRVRLQVPADTALSGTFPVTRNRELELPGTYESVDLSGVLYSEIDSVARAVVSQYVRNPTVRARVLWPVAITGGVSAPGYYNLPPGITLSEALMEAGGPTSSAQLDKIAYRRGDRDLLKSRKEDGGRAPVEVITLADLNARAGDELHVPTGGGGGFGVTQALGIVSGLSGTIFALTRLF